MTASQSDRVGAHSLFPLCLVLPTSNSIVDQYQKLYPESSVPAPEKSNNGETGDPKPTSRSQTDLDSIPAVPLVDLFAGRPGLRRLLDDFAAETR